MSWFSSIGKDLSGAFKAVDSGLNSINPLKQASTWLTDNTVGKIPGVGKPAAQLGDWGISHPAEVAALAAGGYGAYTGLAALGASGAAADVAGEGAALGAGDATAMGAAAGTLGAADSAAASSALGLTAADVGGDAALGGTAMGGAAGILGAADSAGASADLGLTAADVGGAADAAIGPGGMADLSLGGGGNIGLGIGQSAADAYTPTTASGFGGVGTDAGVAASPDGGLALGQATTPSLTSQALSAAAKYGPAGLSLMRSVMGQGAYAKAASALGNVGSTQRATANGLVAGYNNGTLNPAENSGIDTWATNQVSALRQFYANAGTADSTQAKQAEAAVMAQATQMKNQASQNLLQVGLNELNNLDQNTVAGIKVNLQGDQAATQAQANFAATFAKLIGSQQSGNAVASLAGG